MVTLPGLEPYYFAFSVVAIIVGAVIVYYGVETLLKFVGGSLKFFGLNFLIYAMLLFMAVVVTRVLLYFADFEGFVAIVLFYVYHVLILLVAVLLLLFVLRLSKTFREVGLK